MPGSVSEQTQPAAPPLPAGFVLDDDGVFQVPGGPTVPYRDGAEASLLAALRQIDDLEPGSLELARLERDWAHTYHLNTARSVVLDALDFDWRELAVLELGAGCGATTRWLGSRARWVDAVEGDYARARVLRERCRGQNAVRSIAADGATFQPAAAYDVATIIGVLEWADDPHALLVKAAAATGPTGAVVIAIENRLGLKYWSGAPEDHTGVPFDGLHGYRRDGRARTWALPQLDEMLGAAGLDRVDLLLPFPDYKLASTVLRASEIPASPEIVEIVRAPFPHEGARRTPGFVEGFVLRELAVAGALPALANSFLVVAAHRGTDRWSGADRWAGRSYSLQRRREFAKRLTFRRGDDGLALTHEQYEADAQAVIDPEFSFELPREPYIVGSALVDEVLVMVQRPDGDRHFVELLRRYERWLSGGSGSHAALDDEAVDAVMTNIAVAADGSWQAWDLEWRMPGGPPVAWVLWRNLVSLSDALGAYAPGFFGPSPQAFADRWGAAVYGFDAACLADNAAREGRLQVFAHGVGPEFVADWTRQSEAYGREALTRELQAARDLVVAREAERDAALAAAAESHARAHAIARESAMAHEATAADLEAAHETINSMASTRAWRSATWFWSLRGRLTKR